MRIAILTQPLRANYGGVLQNYALQQVLKTLGHSPVTLEKDPYKYISSFRLLCELPKRVITKYILRKRKYILSEKQNNIYIEQVSKILKPFIERYIKRNFVPCYESINYCDYDAFVVGSDQVWRPIYNWDTLDSMYLSFIPKEYKVKRIAYAASFGASQWEYNEEQTEGCSEFIQHFNAVSTREIDGVGLCQKYLNRIDVVNVLDPTLLLNKEDYLKICENIPTNKENLLFAYILDVDYNTKILLEKLAIKDGLTLKLVSAHDDCTLSVEEWVAMFRDAKMVITDSFHGTVFSIIFNKEFYSICNNLRGNSRFTSLLSQFNLQDRLFNDVKSINLNSNQIDWISVENIKSSLQNKSIQFIIDNLTNNA